MDLPIRVSLPLLVFHYFLVFSIFDIHFSPVIRFYLVILLLSRNSTSSSLFLFPLSLLLHAYFLSGEKYSPPFLFNHPLSTTKLFFLSLSSTFRRSAGGEWMTAEVEGSHRAYTAKGLRCGTLHHFYLTAHNHIGKQFVGCE